MKFLDLTLESPESNLALDEALLDEAESSPDGAEWLRLWEPRQQMVVMGRASQVEREVHLDHCQQAQVPVLRRCSGGAAIVTGPGCLMYSLVLGLRDRPQLRIPEQAHRFVLGHISRALESHGPGIALEGTSDLAIKGHKFSGNSLRCKRNHILYHGTLLYDFPLEQISTLLQMPPRQPDYRQEREHHDFVTNLEIGAGPLRQLLVAQWHATGDGADWPQERTGHLVTTRYGKAEWNQ